jgi:hypothetical protein
MRSTIAKELYGERWERTKPEILQSFKKTQYKNLKVQTPPVLQRVQKRSSWRDSMLEDEIGVGVHVANIYFERKGTLGWIWPLVSKQEQGPPPIGWSTLCDGALFHA